MHCPLYNIRQRKENAIEKMKELKQKEGIEMGGIIGFVCCLLCAFPFFIIGRFGKDSKEPVVFWTGDKSLKGKVKDVKSYNREMSKLYKICSLTFVITGMLCLMSLYIGIACIVLECTIGIYIVWRVYKSILSQHV